MKEILNYKNLSIGKKFTVTFCLLLMFPLLILFLWINSNVTQRISEENCNTNLAVLKQTKTAFANMVQDVTSISLEVIGNEELQEYLKNDDLESAEAERLQNLIKYDLGNILTLKNHISRLSVFDEDEILFQFGKYMLEESDAYVQEIKKQEGRMVWKAAAKDDNYLLSHDKQIYEVSIYRAINNHLDYKDVLAYERISIAEDYICNIYAGIANENTREFFIMNKSGEIISSKNKELLSKNDLDKSWISKIIGKQEGYYIDKDEQIVVSYYYLPEVQWYIVKIDDQAAIIGQELIRTMIMICMVLAIVFGIIFHKIQRKRIIRPIIMLSKDVSRFQEGNYEIGTYSEARDEIGVLNNNFIEMGKYIEDLIERVYKSQLREKEAQLKYLQSQINPHFLYNTLDSMRWMAVKQQQYELAELIEALSNLFKHALNQGKEMTTIEKEVQHLKDYLTIQKSRFGNRIRATIFVEDGMEKLNVLNLVLQPLVENSIVHGLEGKIKGGYIHVSVKREDDDILYLVEDDGIGADQEEIRRRLIERTDSRNALALDNINQRIKYKYGENYGVTFYSKIGVGTKVEVRMPLECGGQYEDFNRG